MKKTNKIALTLFSTLIIMSILLTSAFAWPISQYATAAPGGTTGEWALSARDNTITAETSDALGKYIDLNAKVKTFKSLPSKFMKNDGRSYEIYAMEADAVGADDHYKTYAGKFHGLDFIDIKLVKVNIPGSIEPTASLELYTKHRVGKIHGDKASKYTSLFSYYYTN